MHDAEHPTRSTRVSLRSTVLALAAILTVLAAGSAVAAGGVEEHQDGGFDVTVETTNTPVVEGETLRVTVTVENTGNATRTRSVALLFGSNTRDVETVTLAAGEQTTVDLTWTTGDGDAGRYTATVAAPSDSATTDVTVRGDALFTVPNLTTNAPINESERLRVNATIENSGSAAATGEVRLALGSAVRNSTSVRLGSGERTNVTLAWVTEDGDGANYTATVVTPSGSASTDVTVRSNATFAVTNLSTNAPVTADETLEVDADVENVGDLRGNVTVNLTVGGGQRDHVNVTLDAGEATRVSLSWETGPGDSGESGVTVAAGEGAASTDVTVAANTPPAVESIRLRPCDPACEGEPIRAPADASAAAPLQRGQRYRLTPNASDADGSVASYRWVVDGSVLARSEAVNTTFGAAGEHEIRLRATDDDGETTTASVTVAVNAPPRIGTLGVVDCDPDCGGDPVAIAGDDAAASAPTLSYERYATAEFVAPNASDADGSVASYRWVVDGEPAGTGPSLGYTFAEPGRHEVRLRVTDDDNGTATLGTALRLQEPTTTRTTTATPSPTRSTTGNTTTVGGDTTTTSGDGPGFGAVATVLAFLVAVLVAAGRR